MESKKQAQLRLESGSVGSRHGIGIDIFHECPVVHSNRNHIRRFQYWIPREAVGMVRDTSHVGGRFVESF
jgi:hypothetical protein